MCTSRHLLQRRILPCEEMTLLTQEIGIKGPKKKKKRQKSTGNQNLNKWTSGKGNGIRRA
jgi:hypothetical protein